MDFDSEITYNDDKSSMIVNLSAVIFENCDENNYPFEMNITIKGFFKIKQAGIELKQFEANSIAILFPYLRAIVSTFTANVNVAPVILPPMNINAYLENKKNKHI